MQPDVINLDRFHPFIGHKGPQGEQRYSSTLFLTSALEGGEGSVSCPSHTLPPGKTQYPLYRRLCGPQGQCGKSRPHQDSIPGPSSLQAVAIPTTLSGPLPKYVRYKIKNNSSVPATLGYPVGLHITLTDSAYTVKHATFENIRGDRSTNQQLKVECV